jgi:hypothetical protein
MSQESDERLNQPEREERISRPPWYRSSVPPTGGSPRRQQHSSQPVRPIYGGQDERMTRLRELRHQRQRSGYDPAPPDLYTFQRRGIPTPPPAQPSFQEMIKHWWHNGPFAGQSPSAGKKKHADQQGPVPIRQRPPLPHSRPSSASAPLEQRVRTWIIQGHIALKRLGARVRNAIDQIANRMQQKAKSSQRPGKRNHRL